MTISPADISTEDYDVLLCDRRPTAFGVAERVRIHRLDMAPMGFRELWEVFAHFFPGRWAVQSFPPSSRLLDQANKYHLFVYERAPDGIDLGVPAPRGTQGIARYLRAPEEAR